MRLLGLAWIACVVSSSAFAQGTATPPPQSARQALIEMFLGKNTDDFTKHLPDEARQALVHKSETAENSIVLRVASIGREITHSGQRVETFEAGPNILITEDEGAHERVEVAVEHDTLMGEEDEIELSVHYSKDRQSQQLPVIPRLIFTMKQEKDVWRLTEVTVAAHVPLTDPDYLKGLRKQQDEANESAAQARITMLVQAETQYAANHADVGYSCSMAALFPQPQLSGGDVTYAPGVTNEPLNGYRFTLNGCEGSPVTKYRITATPIDPESEMETYCVDQSGTMKFMIGKSSACFSQGTVVNQVRQYSPMD